MGTSTGTGQGVFEAFPLPEAVDDVSGDGAYSDAVGTDDDGTEGGSCGSRWATASRGHTAA